MTTHATQGLPAISIIMRTKNEARYIGQTLEAIFRQDIHLPFEVLIVDSGSTDRTLDIVRQFETRLYTLEPGQFTYGRALNYGAGFAQGTYLINLSAHCVPVHERWMAHLVAPLSDKPHVVATYGQQIPIKGSNPFEERVLITAFTPNAQGHVAASFSNSNCALRKTLWEKYPFDEQASFAEDFIWSQCLPVDSYIEYVVEAAVYHSHPLTWKYWAQRFYDNGLCVQYLEHVYGLHYPWASPTYGTSRASWRRLINTLRTCSLECVDIVKFLYQNKYFRFLPLLPMHLFLEHYHYHRGLTEGYRRYGDPTR